MVVTGYQVKMVKTAKKVTVFQVQLVKKVSQDVSSNTHFKISNRKSFSMRFCIKVKKVNPVVEAEWVIAVELEEEDLQVKTVLQDLMAKLVQLAHQEFEVVTVKMVNKALQVKMVEQEVWVFQEHKELLEREEHQVQTVHREWTAEMVDQDFVAEWVHLEVKVPMVFQVNQADQVLMVKWDQEVNPVIQAKMVAQVNLVKM